MPYPSAGFFHPQLFRTKSAFEMLMKKTMNGISPNKTPTSNNFSQLVQFGTRFHHAIENWISNDKSNQRNLERNSKSSVRVFSLQMCLKSNIQDRRLIVVYIQHFRDVFENINSDYCSWREKKESQPSGMKEEKNTNA